VICSTVRRGDFVRPIQGNFLGRELFARGI
jgi:hypothetical protein